MADKSVSKSVTVPVETAKMEIKQGSLDDNVLSYDPSHDERAPITQSTTEEDIKTNQEKAEEHARQIRSITVEQIFDKRLRTVGGTTPKEAGAAVVMLKEDVTGRMKKELRAERIGKWTQDFLVWVKKQGKEIRSEGGALIGIGDRIEVMPNGHYRYKW